MGNPFKKNVQKQAMDSYVEGLQNRIINLEVALTTMNAFFKGIPDQFVPVLQEYITRSQQASMSGNDTLKGIDQLVATFLKEMEPVVPQPANAEAAAIVAEYETATVTNSEPIFAKESV